VDLITAPYLLRAASSLDAGLIAEQRTKLYLELGKIDPKDEEVFRTESKRMLQSLLESGEYAGWFVEINGKAIAGAGIIIRSLLPNSSNPTGCIEAYILNVYTDPDHRRHGFAKVLVKQILSWCNESRIERITLHTSEIARNLYCELGFVSTAEMRFEGMAQHLDDSTEHLLLNRSLQKKN
jgi:GNAT superfamily N-acetyltransferase